MNWNIDPVFLKLGPIAFRWYGLFFACAFISGFTIMKWIYETESRNPAELEDIFTHMFLGTLIGARLGHCLFYDPLYYLSNPISILKIWEGGLASHGGAMGIIIALYLFSKKDKSPRLLWLLDRIAIPTALGGAFIRTGNFFNSEILGIPTSGWWAVVFQRVDNIPRHPVQIYEALAYLSSFAVLSSIYLMIRNKTKDGLLSGLFLVMVFSARFILEFFKTEQAAYESGFSIRVGQWLSLPFIVAGIFLILRFFNAETINRRP